MPCWIVLPDHGVRVRVPSGKVGAYDPFVNLPYPRIGQVPPGDYHVRVTVADVSEEQDGSHLRETYLSVVLSDAESVTVGAAPGLDGPTPPGHYFTVGVDAGTVAFVDAEAVGRCMPDQSTWYEGIFESDHPGSWFNLVDADGPQPAGTANIVMPLASNGENVVLSAIVEDGLAGQAVGAMNPLLLFFAATIRDIHAAPTGKGPHSGSRK